MPTPRLPQVGSDDNAWGDVLNEFLKVSLNDDGTLKESAKTTATDIVTMLGSLSGNNRLSYNTLKDAPALGSNSYQIAVANGFAGTEGEWLLSLKGDVGAKGADGGTSLFSVAGKKMLVIGDSLSSANGGDMNTPAVGSWCSFVKSYLNLSSSSRVIANGGCSVVDTDASTLVLDKASWSGAANVMSNQVYQLLNHYAVNKGTVNEFVPDIVLIMMGTNNVMTTYPQNNWTSLMGDFYTVMENTDLDPKYYSLPDITTSDGLANYAYIRTFRKTFFGAYRWAIETILQNFPQTQIYICQPLQNSSGRGINIFTLYGYIEQISNFYALKLIKTAYESGLSDFTNIRTGKGWSKSWYTWDGTHPDGAGQELIGKYVSTIINSHYFPKPVINATATAVVSNSFTVTTSIANGGNGVGGNLDLYGVNTVTSGSSFTVNIAPLSGFQTSEILVDGASVTIASSYTFTNVTDNHIIIVTFSAVATVVPVITSMTLSATGTVTNSSETITLVCTNNPTQYRLATSDAGLTSASWVAYSSSISYTLSSGLNTIYCQVMNDAGNSASANVSVTYTPVVVQIPVLSSITLGATGTTSNSTTTVTFNATNTPTHYRLGTTDAGAQAASWITYVSTVSYTLAEGLNTIYAQVKNSAGNSAVVNASVTYTPPPPGLIYKADLAFGQAYSSTLFDAATGVYNAYAINTVKNIYNNSDVLIGTALSNANVLAYNANLIGASTGNNSGVYSDAYLQKNLYITGPTVGTITLTLTAGTYRISTLSNVLSNAVWATYIATTATSTITVNGTAKNPVKIADNTDTFTVFDNVVTADGIITVSFTTSVSNKRLPINMIKIEKLSN